MVIADEIPGQLTHHRTIGDDRELGAPTLASARLEANNVPIEFRRSGQTPGLQAADLVAYLYRRLDHYPDGDQRSRRAADRLWAAIEPAILHVWVWRRSGTRAPRERGIRRTTLW
ncbi:DUF3800 domain-containing protein [Plantibacter flavus]|uniref:DUF3800 domain-containing protein n=1 Tax=Plantibacter flavus TaxID=150123 RepID=UPI003F5CBF39